MFIHFGRCDNKTNHTVLTINKLLNLEYNHLNLPLKYISWLIFLIEDVSTASSSLPMILLCSPVCQTSNQPCMLLSGYAQKFLPYAKLLGLLANVFGLGLFCLILCLCVWVISLVLLGLALCFFTLTHSQSHADVLVFLPNKVNDSKVLTVITKVIICPALTTAGL